MSEHSSHINVGSGILKPSARPVRIFVDDEGEYWYCDSGVSPDSNDFRAAGCTALSDTHMK
jgi:hypothetical protein